MEKTTPIKRVRRKKEALEDDLFNAANTIIAKVGFTGLTVTQLLKEAKADPPVFYNRYKDINDFIDKFVRTYDYWLNDSVSLNEKDLTPTKNAQVILRKQIDSLLENTCMQKLLAWELNEDNIITRRTSQNRDNNSGHLIEYFEENFKKCEVNFNVGIAILTGGIYYLIIHRKMATFNKINFDSPEGINLLKDNLSIMIDKIYGDYNKSQTSTIGIEQNTIDIAKKLLNLDVDIKTIQQATELSEEVILSLK